MLGLGRINEANQYLSQAQWSVLKVSGEVDPLIKSNLHRNLGQLAVAKSNLDEAKRQFAEDVSCICILYVAGQASSVVGCKLAMQLLEFTVKSPSSRPITGY